MALYYNLVFGLLVIEMVLFGILSLPLPSKIRKPLITTISKPFQLSEFNVALKCILVFILILFVDSVNRVNSISEELRGFGQTGPGAAPLSDRSEIQARKFYAQRNLYLTGFTLFLTLIVSRTYSLVAELLSLKEEVRANPDALSTNQEYVKLQKELEDRNEKIDILKQQAESLRKDYDQLSEEVNKKGKSTNKKSA